MKIQQRHRPLRLEQLQPRELFAVDSLAWNDASSLRLSFVPDGTLVGKQASNLDAVMTASPAGTAWRDSVVKAFQIWSQYAAINVGVVTDNGLPIGTTGPTHGDDRFGDVRVAGLPMSADTWAAAVSHGKVSSGSWAGDLFFNTTANWNQHPDDLLRVALHEAGHVLGLPHNADVNSPMHEHGVPSSLTPAASDIALLQQMYGIRTVDANETAKPNDTTRDATRMRFSDVASNFDGTRPLIHYGEITTASDRDIFYFEVPQTYHNTTTVHVESRGLSQLEFRLTIKDLDGNTIASSETLTPQGGEVHLTIPGTPNGGKYYLQIDAVGDNLNRLGSYAVIVELDTRVAVPYATTLVSVQKASRWFASSPDVLGTVDVGALALSQNNGSLVDDKGGNDSSSSATRVEPFLDNAQRRVARSIGTLSSDTDQDNFRFRSPRPPSGKTFGMLVQIDALERDQLVPYVEVYDDLGTLLPVKYLVNGNGEVKLWIANVAENKDYTVRVISITNGHNTGNYEITATFQEDTPTIPLLAEVQLTDKTPTSELVWYVAKPELFSLAIESTYDSSLQPVPVWARIMDAKSHEVFSLAALTNQFRTANGVLLMPGTYYLELGSAPSKQKVTLRLLGTDESDPLGPAPIDPATSPIFGCPDAPDKFCYPPDFESLIPFKLLPEPPFDLPEFVDPPTNLPPSSGFTRSDLKQTALIPLTRTMTERYRPSMPY